MDDLQFLIVAVLFSEPVLYFRTLAEHALFDFIVSAWFHYLLNEYHRME